MKLHSVLKDKPRTEKTSNLHPLSVGDVCRVQNQTGHHPTKWDKTGVVVQVNEHDQYLIKMHGSGRVTLRNRKFLRKIQPPTSHHLYIPAPAPNLPTAADSTDDGVSLRSELEHNSNADSPVIRAPLAQPAPPTATPSSSHEGSIPVSSDVPLTDNSTVQTNQPTATPPTTTTIIPPSSRPARSRRPPAWQSDYEMH